MLVLLKIYIRAAVLPHASEQNPLTYPDFNIGFTHTCVCLILFVLGQIIRIYVDIIFKTFGLGKYVFVLVYFLLRLTGDLNYRDVSK